MRLGGPAKFLVTVESEDELAEAVQWARDKEVPLRMIGSGANIVFGDEGYLGLIIVNKILGHDEVASDKDSVTFKAGGGETWDDFVALSVSQNLSGIETLSLIPGTVGAAPVQNIGAYGQQISDSIVELRAFDLEQNKMVTLKPSDCDFSYRASRFNRQDKGKFLIASVTIKLSKKPTVQPPYYADVTAFLEEHEITKPTISQIRQAVIAIRTRKLPDPRTVANCGSFFYNPVVSPEVFAKLSQKYQDLKSHQTDDGQLKLYAGQLIEIAGFKGIHDPETGMAIWPKQALVLINESASTTADLLKFKSKITDKVHDLFGVTLEQEPELFT